MMEKVLNDKNTKLVPIHIYRKNLCKNDSWKDYIIDNETGLAWSYIQILAMFEEQCRCNIGCIDCKYQSITEEVINSCLKINLDEMRKIISQVPALQVVLERWKQLYSRIPEK